MRGLILILAAVLIVPALGCRPDECCAQEFDLEGYFTPAEDPAAAPEAAPVEQTPVEQALAEPPASQPACQAGQCAPAAAASTRQRYAGRPRPLRRFFGLFFRRCR